MTDVLIGLLASFITFMIGVVSRWAVVRSKEISPSRRIWKFPSGTISSINIVTANTPEEYRLVRSEYALTGWVCEYLAAAQISIKLRQAYKGIQTRIFMQIETRDEVKSNLILIGGPINNPITRTVMEQANFPYIFENYDLVNKKTGRRFVSQISENSSGKFVEKDFVLIVNCKNMFNLTQRIILIAGCRSVGCLAGASYLTDVVLGDKENRNFLGKTPEYAIVLEAITSGINSVGVPRVVEKMSLN